MKRLLVLAIAMLSMTSSAFAGAKFTCTSGAAGLEQMDDLHFFIRTAAKFYCSGDFNGELEFDGWGPGLSLTITDTGSWHGLSFECNTDNPVGKFAAVKAQACPLIGGQGIIGCAMDWKVGSDSGLLKVCRAHGAVFGIGAGAAVGTMEFRKYKFLP